MLDERALIDRLESADTETLTDLLRGATDEEEKVLRLHLGDARFQRMRLLALKMPVGRGPRGAHTKGNVIVIPGLMGSELSAVDRQGQTDRVWLHPLRLIGGRFSQLQLAPDGLADINPELEIRPTGILKRFYGELLLSLSARWNVRAFWYDWRKDLRIAAAQLDAAINSWFRDGEPVHIVAHSMGGLVARMFIQDHPHRWKAGGRLIMLGTPNRGAFLVPQALTGRADTVRYLAAADFKHSLDEIVTILNTFPGLYQLMPSPAAVASAGQLYDVDLYGSRFQLSASHLETARQRHITLDEGPFERMIYIAGCNQPTVVGLDPGRLKELLHGRGADASPLECYEIGHQGDGTVPHVLGLLPQVPTYYLDESHTGLTSNADLLEALDSLLETGESSALCDTPPARRGGSPDARTQLAVMRAADEMALENAVHHLQSRGAAENSPVSAYEREVSEILVRSIFAVSPERQSAPGIEAPFPPPTLEIDLVCGSIVDLEMNENPAIPIDAIAVGQYQGDMPSDAMLELDRAISKALAVAVDRSDSSRLLLTGLAARGILRGNRGGPFFLPDPRSEGDSVQRLIAVAGLGAPGQLGIPELTMVVRELCWSLGWVGQHHLATLLIGAGTGNLFIEDAVSAWIRGAKYALTGIPEEDSRRLLRITFVEREEKMARRIDAALIQEAAAYATQKRFLLKYSGLRFLRAGEREQPATPESREGTSSSSPGVDEARDARPGRISISLQDDRYTFGAVTDNASIPERSYPMDRMLVEQANDEIAAALNLDDQLEHGRFLARLLIPRDLRPQFDTGGPLVLMLDASAARIHWEVLAPTDATNPEPVDRFLGSSRGVTRQLRTAFAPPPDPAPAANRVLRVLVVANPDGSLRWAEEEGEQVARLFESFNTVYASSQSRIEVVTLFGPHEATRLNVLRNIMARTYDVFHYAGHCAYVPEDRKSSGWVFAGGERLTANELSRVDRVPQFVFSNACESGVTPDRSGERSADLAPVFAETFFAQGVANFVCTSWPVEDEAARRFAIEVYSRLLGLELEPSDQPASSRPHYRKSLKGPQPMYEAMREARRALCDPRSPSTTWGAYQHYGNPLYRLFHARTGADV